MTRRTFSMGCLIFIAIIFLFIIINILSFKSRKKVNTYSDIKMAYISETKDLAVKTAKKYDLFASVILAQSALESNFGQSELSLNYNNYFGIKSNVGVKFETSENIDGKDIRLDQIFATYKNKKESFNSYALLITQAKRYERVKNAKSPDEACKFLKECGYATDPNYEKSILNIIEQFNLRSLDEF